VIPGEHRSAWSRWLTLPFVAAIRVYQVLLGPFMGGHCRFHPSCSNYAIEAYRLHGPVRGSWLTLRRLSRCHPIPWLNGRGYDPVPLPEHTPTVGLTPPPGPGSSDHPRQAPPA
jgi:putative membrane protein insertion efficiency factor